MDLSPHKSGFVTVGDGVRLHYLDWGGRGPALVFIPGMGCTAHIFDRFAPRFTDGFRVLALTRRGHGESDYPESGYDPDTLTDDLRQFLDALEIDQVILAGHSMGYIELSRFAHLYPDRVLKLVWMDAAYDRTNPEDQAMLARNPISQMIPPWPSEPIHSIDEFAATLKRLYPSLAAIWGPEMDAELRANVTFTPAGHVVDKMSDAIGSAFSQVMKTYPADYASIHAPMLSFFVLVSSQNFISCEYMSDEQKAQVIDYVEHVRTPHVQAYIEQFRRSLPHAQIVVIPNGHHYCFMQQEEVVYQAMRDFLGR